jgi:hypothetical protein
LVLYSTFLKGIVKMFKERRSFVEEHINFAEKKIEYYQQLNEIGLEHKKFPYNILKITVKPTYKTINLLYKEPIYKVGGFEDLRDILVFVY